MLWIVLACSEEIKENSEPSAESESPQQDTAESPVDTSEQPQDTAPPCEEQLWYLDSDGDGYGSLESGVTCNGVLPENGSFQSGDCNDANSTVYPDAPGTGTGLDNDCSGTVDADEEEVVCPEDVNGDGFISVADILAVLAEFGCNTGCEADVDGDGNVIVSDLLLLLAAFGVGCC